MRFDTNQAQPKTGGIRNVERLAEFVRQYPQRNVMIEGFTDSTGSDSPGNDTAAGRQMNRRVEIVVSDDSGNIAAR